MMAKTNAAHQKGYRERKKGCRRFQIFAKKETPSEKTLYKSKRSLKKGIKRKKRSREKASSEASTVFKSNAKSFRNVWR